MFSPNPNRTASPSPFGAAPGSGGGSLSMSMTLTPGRAGTSMFSPHKKPRWEDATDVAAEAAAAEVGGLKVCALAPREFTSGLGGLADGAPLGGSVDASGWALTSGEGGRVCVWELCIAREHERPKEPRKVYSFQLPEPAGFGGGGAADGSPTPPPLLCLLAPHATTTTTTTDPADAAAGPRGLVACTCDGRVFFWGDVRTPQGANQVPVELDLQLAEGDSILALEAMGPDQVIVGAVHGGVWRIHCNARRRELRFQLFQRSTITGLGLRRVARGLGQALFGAGNEDLQALRGVLVTESAAAPSAHGNVVYALTARQLQCWFLPTTDEEPAKLVFEHDIFKPIRQALQEIELEEADGSPRPGLGGATLYLLDVAVAATGEAWCLVADGPADAEAYADGMDVDEAGLRLTLHELELPAPHACRGDSNAAATVARQPLLKPGGTRVVSRKVAPHEAQVCAPILVCSFTRALRPAATAQHANRLDDAPTPTHIPIAPTQYVSPNHFDRTNTGRALVWCRRKRA